jgi:hypothetical protein
VVPEAVVSVLPITEVPPEPECCDDEIHLPPLEFPTALDEALRGRCPADPSTVHIRQRREAA